MRLFLLCLFFCFQCFNLAVVAQEEGKIVSIDDITKQVTVEIKGVQYKFSLNQAIEMKSLSAEAQSKTLSPSSTSDSDLERQFLALNKNENQYTGLPTVLGTRLYVSPTDHMMKKGHFGLDFTHRFASSFKEKNDFFGLDSFAYSGFGVYYGITDSAEIHAMRANIADTYEVGLKAKLLQETKDFSFTHPINLTLNTGFQNDNVQNSLDPYIQLIASRSLVPNRVQLYASPIYAWRTNSINSGGSSSAIYSSFADNKGRVTGNQGTFAIPLGLAAEVVKNKVTLVGEIIPVLSGFQENKMGWASGLQFASRRETHIWTLGISNMPYVPTGQSIVGGPDNKIYLGFNLSVFL